MRQSLSMGTTLLQVTEVFPGYPCPVLIDQAGQICVLFLFELSVASGFKKAR